MTRARPRKSSIVGLARLQAVQGGFSIVGMIVDALKGKDEPYLEVKLENTQVSSY